MGAITGKILCSAIMANSAFFGDAGTSRGCEYSTQIVASAIKHDVDPYLLAALVHVESNWKKGVVSKSGACGLTQVLHKYSKFSCKELKDSKTGLDEGARKLNFWINKYGGGKTKIGLCGYNAGFRCKGKNVNKRGLKYAKKVLAVRDKLKNKK